MINGILGWIMKVCYVSTHNYGIAIILFTLITKILLFPISILVQKNSITLVKITPQIKKLKYLYIDDKERFMDEQVALYKREHYSPLVGVIPLLIQIPLILGLITVVYHPLQYILGLSKETIEQFIQITMNILGGSSEESGIQLKVIEAIAQPAYYKLFQTSNRLAAQTIKQFSTMFMHIDLALLPSIKNGVLSFVWPILAVASTALLCIVQNRINVLQIQQGKVNRWAMSLFTVGITASFAFVVPSAIGLYWTVGNVIAIAQMYFLNYLYDPKKYIDYDLLKVEKQVAEEQKKKVNEYVKKEKEDYKRFFEQEDMKVLFYAEQKGFYKYYAGIIEALLAQSNLEIHYVTSDPEDPVLLHKNDRVKGYYIASTSKLIALFMKVDVDIFVMTTPDLEKYHLKRSKVRDDVEYIFTDHGGTSLNLTYRKGALDHFDTIFSVSEEQTKEIRAMEMLRNSKRKRIVKTGYPLIDDMVKAYEQTVHIYHEKKKIVIAPSWQPDNIMDLCLEELIENIGHEAYEVVIRPHPQYVRHHKEMIEQLHIRYKDEKNILVEDDFSSSSTIYDADVVITDWSGVALDFAFTTKKPVLYINTPMKISNPDYGKIDIIPFDITVRSQIGVSINPDEMKKAKDALKQLLNDQETYRERLMKIMNEYFYHIGCSGEIGAKYIIQRVLKKDISVSYED